LASWRAGIPAFEEAVNFISPGELRSMIFPQIKNPPGGAKKLRRECGDTTSFRAAKGAAPAANGMPINACLRKPVRTTARSSGVRAAVLRLGPHPPVKKGAPQPHPHRAIGRHSQGLARTISREPAGSCNGRIRFPSEKRPVPGREPKPEKKNHSSSGVGGNCRADLGRLFDAVAVMRSASVPRPQARSAPPSVQREARTRKPKVNPPRPHDSIRDDEQHDAKAVANEPPPPIARLSYKTLVAPIAPAYFLFAPTRRRLSYP